MKIFLDPGSKILQEPGKKAQLIATNWHVWFPCAELSPKILTIVGKYASPAPSKDKEHNGQKYLCFAFGAHLEGALGKASSCFHEING